MSQSKYLKEYFAVCQSPTNKYTKMLFVYRAEDRSLDTAQRVIGNEFETGPVEMVFDATAEVHDLIDGHAQAEYLGIKSAPPISTPIPNFSTQINEEVQRANP